MSDVNPVRDELRSFLTSGQPINVCAHSDADGIFSAAMIASVAKIDKIAFPDVFGDWSQPPGTSLILDMVPLQLKIASAPSSPGIVGTSPMAVVKDYTGWVIDHHPQHPAAPPYKLYNTDEPTCLMVYRLLKDKMPEHLSWKVVGGLVGEGQPELTPPEVWDKHPVLFEQQTRQYETYGTIKIYPMAVWNSLSVNVNSLSRIGQAYQGYEIARSAASPWDILHHPAALKARNMVKAEEGRILKERSGLDFGKLFVLVFDSDYKIESILATRLSQVLKGKTTLVINGKMKRISARGVLAMWLGQKLEKYGIVLKGHMGYCGGSLTAEQDPDFVLNCIRKVI